MKSKHFQNKQAALESIKGWLNFPHTKKEFIYVANLNRIEIAFKAPFGVVFGVGKALYTITIVDIFDGGCDLHFGVDTACSFMFKDCLIEYFNEGKIALTKNMKKKLSI